MKKFAIIAILFTLCIAIANADEKAGPKVSGLVFFDYFHNVGMDPGITSFSNVAVPGKKDDYGFQFRRVFFTVEYDVSSDISARFRLEADGSTQANNGNLTTFMKDMYFKYKNIFTGTDLYVGLQNTIAYEISESVWGYRCLDKTQMDLRNIVASRDIGASLKGSYSDGMINYAVQYGNASGPKAESNVFKRVSGIFQLKPMNEINVTAYAEQNWGDKGKDAMLFAFSAGYIIKDKFSIGAELFAQNVKNSFNSLNEYDVKKNSSDPAKSDTVDHAFIDKKVLGFSVYSWYNIIPELAIIARYDMFNPNTDASDIAKGDSRNFIEAGLDWKISKNFSIIPNIQYEMYESKPETTKKYNNLALGTLENKVSKAGDYKNTLTARITFFYKF
ncbi:MAG: hypothetical protein HW421_983 [Ignavibacteria bacterium]|nr:hypothetical protein [Ignavibacteria bacterium]